MGAFAKILHSAWFGWAARLVLGGLFIIASLQKIADPASFAQNIENYRLMPLWSVNLLALYLPWLELLAGVFLIAGFWMRGSALAIVAMLAVFTGAIGQAAARGIKLHCGCLSAQGEPAEISEMVWKMLANVGFLAVGLLFLRRNDGDGGEGSCALPEKHLS